MNQLKDACVLMAGSSAWAFESLAEELSNLLQIEISPRSRRWNYVLATDDIDSVMSRSFIPIQSIQLAADKRLIAAAFAKANVPSPRTLLIQSRRELQGILDEESGTEWCLKFPTSCGGAGHLLLSKEASIPKEWPTPFVFQEFIRLSDPAVYRIYAADKNLFGWVRRGFPSATKSSPWVAHARGAIYEFPGDPPQEALDVAKAAFRATCLFESFGCVDLIQNQKGEWLALEVGTDGLFNHVDRDLPDITFLSEMKKRIAASFEKYTSSGR